MANANNRQCAAKVVSGLRPPAQRRPDRCREARNSRNSGDTDLCPLARNVYSAAPGSRVPPARASKAPGRIDAAPLAPGQDRVTADSGDMLFNTLQTVGLRSPFL